MKISQKLMVSGIGMIVLLIIIGIAGIIQVNNMGTGVDEVSKVAGEISSKGIPLLQSTVVLDKNMLNTKIQLRAIMMGEKESELKEIENNIDGIYNEISPAYGNLKSFKVIDKIKKDMTEIRKELEASIKIKRDILENEEKRAKEVDLFLKSSKNIEVKIDVLEENYKKRVVEDASGKVKNIIKLIEFQLKKRKELIEDETIADEKIAENMKLNMTISKFFYIGGVGQKGHAFIMDKNQKILFHPYLTQEENRVPKFKDGEGYVMMSGYPSEDRKGSSTVMINYKKTQYRGIIICAVYDIEAFYNLTQYKQLRTNYLEMIGYEKDSFVLKDEKYNENMNRWNSSKGKFISLIGEQKRDSENEFNKSEYKKLESVLKEHFDSFEKIKNLQDVTNKKWNELYTIMGELDKNIAVSAKNVEEIRRETADIINSSIKNSDNVNIEMKGKAKASSNMVFVILIVGVVVGVGGSIIIKNMITRPVEILKLLMKKAEKGDLRVQSELKTKDEIKELADSFNMMISGVKELITESKDVSREVNEEVEVLVSSIIESRAVTESIANNTAVIKRHSEENLEKLSRFSEDIGGMTAKVEAVGASSENSLEKTGNMEKISVGGKKVSEELKNEVNKVSGNSSEITKLIEKLNSEIENINGFLDKINNLSEQTDMLALNAAIEAARAGESGKGFAVVASEIRKLSSETDSVARQIAGFIKNIAEKTKDVVDKADASKIIVEVVKQKLDDVIINMDKIVAEAKDTTCNIKNITDKTKEQLDNFVKIKKEIDILVMDNNQNLEEIKNVNMSLEEQNKTIEYMSQIAETVNSKAENLNTIIKKFEV